MALELGVCCTVSTDPGGGGGCNCAPFEYLMPVPQTTAVIDHTLGYDPASVMVIVDGTVRSEYSVSFPIPGQRVLVGFDVSVQALIRMI